MGGADVKRGRPGEWVDEPQYINGFSQLGASTSSAGWRSPRALLDALRGAAQAVSGALTTFLPGAGALYFRAHWSGGGSELISRTE